MSAELHIDNESQSAERVLVTVRGAVDVHTAGRLRDALVDAVDNGAIAIVVDLLEVAFVDSAGFSALLAGAKRAHARDGHLAIVTTDDSVLRMLKIMALADTLPAFATRDEAWAEVHDGA